MLKLYYTGPKPQISQHGVFFKKGKEDKYVYLELATKILLAIDKNYDMKKAYVTKIDENKTNNCQRATEGSKKCFHF